MFTSMFTFKKVNFSVNIFGQKSLRFCLRLEFYLPLSLSLQFAYNGFWLMYFLYNRYVRLIH